MEGYKLSETDEFALDQWQQRLRDCPHEFFVAAVKRFRQTVPKEYGWKLSWPIWVKSSSGLLADATIRVCNPPLLGYQIEVHRGLAASYFDIVQLLLCRTHVVKLSREVVLKPQLSQIEAEQILFDCVSAYVVKRDQFWRTPQALSLASEERIRIENEQPSEYRRDWSLLFKLMIDFSVGHELGHLLAGHLPAQHLKEQALRWEREYVADEIGIKLLVAKIRADELSSQIFDQGEWHTNLECVAIVSALAGVALFFSLEEMKQKRARTQRLNWEIEHPPAKLRYERVKHFCVEKLGIDPSYFSKRIYGFPSPDECQQTMQLMALDLFWRSDQPDWTRHRALKATELIALAFKIDSDCSLESVRREVGEIRREIEQRWIQADDPDVHLLEALIQCYQTLGDTCFKLAHLDDSELHYRVCGLYLKKFEEWQGSPHCGYVDKLRIAQEELNKALYPDRENDEARQQLIRALNAIQEWADISELLLPNDSEHERFMELLMEATLEDKGAGPGEAVIDESDLLEEPLEDNDTKPPDGNDSR